MSFRISLRTAQTAYRSLSTTSIRFAETPAPVQNERSTGSFDDLSSILNDFTSPQTPSPLPTFTFSSTANASAGSSKQIGYTPAALPPKVDPVLELFTNMLMKGGRKHEAQSRMTRILELIRETSNQPPVPLLHKAILLTSPSVKNLNMRKPTRTIPSPRPLNERQRVHQSIAWILKVASKGRKATARREERIAKEILAILEGESDVYGLLEQRHKEAYIARSNIFAK